MFLFALLLPLICFSQYEKQIDSLQKLVSKTKDIDKKGNAYAELALIYLDSDIEKAAPILDQLKALNKNNKCPKCEAYYWMYSGHMTARLGKIKEAIPLYEKAFQKAKTFDDDYIYLKSKAHIAQCLLDVNQTNEAEKLLLNVLNEYKATPTQIGLEDFYYLLGSINYEKRNLNKALDYLIQAETNIKATDPDGVFFKIAIIGEITHIYMELKNKTKAFETNKKAMEIARKVKKDMVLMQTLIDNGLLETQYGNPKEAIKILAKPYQFYTEMQYPLLQSLSAKALGEAYNKTKNYSESSKYLTTAETFYLESNDTKKLIEIYCYQANNSCALNQLSEAQNYLLKAKKLIGDDTISSQNVLYLDSYALFLKSKNDYSSAFTTLKKRDSIASLVNDELNNDTFQNLETKYQANKKEQELKLLSEKSKLQNTIYLSILGVLIALGGFLFYGYRNKIKTAEKLKELNDLKSRFFANISHEFRTPLTLIKSPVQSLKSEINNENQQNKLDLIDKNSNRMLELVDQLLELSKIDSGKLQLLLKEGNISTFLNSIIEPFEYQAKESQLQFNSSIEKTTENHYFDKDVIEKIVTNLLSNALKYTPEKQTISFTSSVENKQLQLTVSNSGSDIKKEDLPKLFERFYQKNEAQKGVGIGLALVKELVELYQGSIETQLENSTLSFIITIPMESTLTNAIVVTKGEQKSVSNEEISSDNELPVVLIVDDNPEIRTVLKDIFKENYQILEAQDGEQALEIASKEVPDCIISDVMMPKMDGYELTKAVKNNELTSFIPVILVTAKTTDEDHLQGLKSTADAYLTKPFNNEIVKQTVIQLLNERKKLHDRYSQELILKPTDIVINSADEKFLEKLQVVLDNELSNADFSADDFASFMGMSRMQLHRKLKSLLGVSTTEFLRKERIKMAATLLKKANVTIAEIAYAVGFNDVSYFIRCFKEVYNCTPSEYQENN